MNKISSFFPIRSWFEWSHLLFFHGRGPLPFRILVFVTSSASWFASEKNLRIGGIQTAGFLAQLSALTNAKLAKLDE